MRRIALMIAVGGITAAAMISNVAAAAIKYKAGIRW